MQTESAAAAVAVDDDWVFEYVGNLFATRGYDIATDSDARRILDTQLPIWRRKLAQAGLGLNEDRAADVAFNFAGVRVQGGAARIYEFFAEFLKNNPANPRPAEPAPRRGWACKHCGGLGVIVAPVHNRDGRRKDAAFRCVCDSGARYAATATASAEILEFGASIQDEDRELARFWFSLMGLDYDQAGEEVLLAAGRQRLREMMAEVRGERRGRRA